MTTSDDGHVDRAAHANDAPSQRGCPARKQTRTVGWPAAGGTSVIGSRQVAVISDVVRSASLHYWSQISLVVWDMPVDRYAVHVALSALSRDPRIKVIDKGAVTRRQRDTIAHEAISLTDDRR
jgi:hypothetical protein